MRHFTEEAIQLVDLKKEPGLNGTRLLMFDASLLPTNLVFELGRLLSPPELRKAARFRQMEDRRAYLTGRGMIRKMAGEVLNVPGAGLVLQEGQYGKPELKDYAKVLPFNLSNSGNLIVIAFDFTGRGIGVDVEKIDPYFDYEDVMEHYFSKKECVQIHSHHDFYRFWTMKEALLKLTGAGLVEDLPNMDLSAPVNRVKVKDERLLPFKKKTFTLYTISSPEIVCSVAVMGVKLCANDDSGMSVCEVTFQ